MARSPEWVLRCVIGMRTKLRLIADIVRISDGAAVGSINLDTAELATTDSSLFAAWDRLRQDGVRHSERQCAEPLSRATLGHALSALQAQGFEWRIDGVRKRRL